MAAAVIERVNGKRTPPNTLRSDGGNRKDAKPVALRAPARLHYSRVSYVQRVVSRPEAQGSSLYPNEVAADFAFLPFGGGMRKCVGDQFALLEATVAAAMLLRCYRALRRRHSDARQTLCM